MGVEIHGFDEAVKQLEKMQYGLTEEGINEYLSDIKKQANKICGLTEEEVTLKAVKKGDNITIDFSIKDRTKLQCMQNAMESVYLHFLLQQKPFLNRWSFK